MPALRHTSMQSLPIGWSIGAALLLTSCTAKDTAATLTHHLADGASPQESYRVGDVIGIDFDAAGHSASGCRTSISNSLQNLYELSVLPDAQLQCVPADEESDPNDCDYNFSLKCTALFPGEVQLSVVYLADSGEKREAVAWLWIY